MNIFECFPSRWIKAADLRGREHNVTIDRVDLETVDDDNIKPVVYFTGHKKGLLLNRTNASVIADLYSPETEEWTGQPLTLFPTETDYRGSVVDCVRVRRPAPQRKSAKSRTRRSRPAAASSNGSF